MISRPLFAVVLCLSSSLAFAGDWPQFLGLNRNGISSEKNLIDTFPETGPKELWRIKAGVGMSAVSISDGKAVTLFQSGGKQRVIAVDAKSGKTLWTSAVAPQYRNQMGNGPRATPTIDGEMVYVFTGEGILVALKLTDGSLKWKRNGIVETGSKPADYGMASSPLIVGDLVIVTVGVTAGSKAGTVMAYNKRTGILMWKAGEDTAGYSSPTLLTVGGKPQIVAYTGESVIGIAPKTGKLLWRFPYITEYECNIAVPLSINGHVFISSGENHGCALLSLKPAGDKFLAKPVWETHGKASALRNEWQTSILRDGYLYGLDNVGSAGPITHLNCVEAKTGKIVWQKKRFGKSNLIYADGKLWFTTMKGELVLVKATPKGYEELARSKPVLSMTRQAPTLANGHLYVRDDKDIVCYDVRK